MAIKLNTRIFNVINQIIKGNVFTLSEMKNSWAVISYLYTIKEKETAMWVENHKIEYLRGMLEGFEIDNTQEAQLKDIHRGH